MVTKKQEMIKLIEDENQAKLFDDPNLNRIIAILRKGDLNTKQIHKLFNKDYEDRKTLASIYRYLDKLAENDLIFISKEELKREHLIEKYYSRTAKFFLFPTSKCNKKCADATLELLEQVYDLDENEGEELKELLAKYNKNMEKIEVNFLNKYGEEALELEGKYGFKVLLNCLEMIYTFIQIKKNPELFQKILKIMEV